MTADVPPAAPPNLWAPLRIPIFRSLFVADLISDMGTFMQSVGAAWLMVSLGASPTLVALTQTASSLPFFVFALPAGALGDIVDRRKLILACEYWMVGVAMVLAVVTIAGRITPGILLVLTFALSAGDAFETPTWRAVLPELVDKADLAPASALNGIEFNFARSAGPALAGVVIAVAGVGAAFVLNVVSFAGVILVIARWTRVARRQTAPIETVSGAMIAAVRYVHYAPIVRFVMIRAGLTMFAASSLLALLPTVARTMSAQATVYGLLLGAFGVGAVLGAVAMQPARGRWPLETVASGAVVLLGVMIVAAGEARSLSLFALVMLVAGSGWLAFISLVSALVQNLAPDWARARVLAIFILIFQGGLAAGSAMWGAIATRIGIPHTFLLSGLCTIATIALSAVATLPDATVDTTPWNQWRLPTIPDPAAFAVENRVTLVTVRYRVRPGRVEPFLRAMDAFGLIRRRDGASQWGIFRDIEHENAFVEVFLVTSWAEHIRQHERFTRADSDVATDVRGHLEDDPVVDHFIDAHLD